MPDVEKVIGHMNDCLETSRADNGWVFVRKDIIADALALLKEHETVEHACDILRANGRKETEPICSECGAVHVVQCKDCKISKLEKVFKNVPTSTETVRWCELINRYVDDGWFCADGERS